MTRPETVTYSLLVRAKQSATDPAAIRKLRWLLKRLVRSGGFQVIRCEPERPIRWPVGEWDDIG